MKYILIILAALLCLATSAQAEPKFHTVLLAENLENGSASSLKFSVEEDFVYAGLSLNYIESDQVIQYDNRTAIYPVYMFLGLKAPWRLAPFAELGFDLGDEILQELFDSEFEEDQVDIYYAGGLRLSLTDKLFVSVFAKRYHFIFRETAYSPLVRVSPESYGIGVSVRF